jgi:hypothetical protein
LGEGVGVVGGGVVRVVGFYFGLYFLVPSSDSAITIALFLLLDRLSNPDTFPYHQNINHHIQQQTDRKKHCCYNFKRLVVPDLGGIDGVVEDLTLGTDWGEFVEEFVEAFCVFDGALL